MDYSQQIAHVAASLLGPMRVSVQFSDAEIRNAVTVARKVIAESNAQFEQELAQFKAK